MNSQKKDQPRVRRSLFWRLWLRSLTVKRPQAALAIGSVLVGATVASMLLNLYGDARRKMTQEFRAYGPNVVLAPADLPGAMDRALPAASSGRTSNSDIMTGVIDQSVMRGLTPFTLRRSGFSAVPVLYVVTRLSKTEGQASQAAARPGEPENVVAVGTDFNALSRLYPSWRIKGRAGALAGLSCAIGTHIASRLRLGPGDSIDLGIISPDAGQSEPARESFRISSILSTGTSEDDQVFVPLESLQKLGGLEGKISLVQMIVPGETAEVERELGELTQSVRGYPNIEVHPIRQIVYSAGKVLDTIRWVMFSLTGLILIIIALCVTATMTAIVLERRKDIAVMKSLGASDQLVMQLFLSEGATLGMIGGLAGFGLGLALAHQMARHLFNVSLSLTWWTFPLVCLGSMMLAVVATLFPVEMVHNIQPARVLRGE